jgi:hypothetical protein
MSGTPDDPRSEAEKARADLKRNAEMDSSSIPMSPMTRQPSVTPDTFGEHWDKARALSGSTEGIEAGGAKPSAERGGSGSESIAESPQEVVGRDRTRPVTENEDALSRAKE